MPVKTRKRLLIISVVAIVVTVGWSVLSHDFFDFFRNGSRTQLRAALQSPAEKVVTIRRLIDFDRARKVELDALLVKLNNDFDSASSAFSRLDQKPTVTPPQAVGTGASDQRGRAQEAKLDAEGSQQQAVLDRIIRYRKAVSRQLDALVDKLAVSQTALDRMTSVAPEQRLASKPVATATPTASASQAATTVAAAPTGTTPVALPPATSAATASAEEAAEPVVDERLIEARKDRIAKDAALEAAKENLQLRDQAATVFERDLEAGTELLTFAREELATASRAAKDAADRLAERRRAGASEADVAALSREAEQAATAADVAQKEVEKQGRRLSETREVLAYLQEGRDALERRFEQASSDLENADRKLRFLESPLAPANITRWFLRTVPRIAIIGAIVVAFWWLIKILAARVVTVVMRRRNFVDPEREGRVETLRRVFQSTAGTGVIVLGGLALLDQAGLDVTVLLGGAAVIGAAVAFGSQNLIKDFFSGFMILMENQYSVGHVIKLGGVSGLVEDITLRMTVLRDEAGALHFIPHGQVTTVSNMTHGWSRAVITLRVGYEEDIDRIIDVLKELLDDFTRDEKFKGDFLGAPEVLGVDSLEEYAVIVKLLLKTRPMSQWNIKREALRRIKIRFDELGIEIPVPQREVHVSGDGAAEPTRSSSRERDYVQTADGRRPAEVAQRNST